MFPELACTACGFRLSGLKLNYGFFYKCQDQWHRQANTEPQKSTLQLKDSASLGGGWKRDPVYSRLLNLSMCADSGIYIQ